MARLKRLESHRYVGSRDDMRVYDTDNSAQAATLAQRIESDDLVAENLVQTFAPDELSEVRNRGFKPVR
ncbi:MAG: hypothetical protein HKN91_13675 [Acidimicrobiia bacterium]|nr:hypothetical protein [Acidimicrobiia bacterium]